ncbi:hypothetical protein I3842_Q066600 [Carya illinoinensis]|uniref:Uncharacterized protein n=1 Tax=Carya illinoinensis TaxID=32201 RepID=A0A922D0C6_CARIL|nr:hypothetical protein I3842_Q066600 [Carya illinoinensis]
MFKEENSTLPPILNAFEIYFVKDFLQPETERADVDAIRKIKSTYGIKRNWQGDPCAPKKYLWEGLDCSYDADNAPRITSLNLSSSGLTGEISADTSNLLMLQSLDLSNNSLTGSVPNFLSKLTNLTVLNLKRNEFTGSIPRELIARSDNGLLLLRRGAEAIVVHVAASSASLFSSSSSLSSSPLASSTSGFNRDSQFSTCNRLRWAEISFEEVRRVRGFNREEELSLFWCSAASG